MTAGGERLSARPILTVLGVRVVLTGPDAVAAARSEWRELFVTTSPPAAREVTLALQPGAPDGLAELTAAVVRNSPLLCVHAAVLELPEGGILAVPGPSGLGKSTLCAALLRAGFGYVSDEVLAVDRDTRAVFGFPRPLALSGRSWRLLGLDGVGPAVEEDEERFIQPRTLGDLARACCDDAGGRLRHLVLATRHGVERTTVQRVSRGRAVEELLRRSFNHFTDPAGSFRAATQLARETDVWRLSYTDARDVPDLLSGLAYPDTASK